ncbi:hypothetical protein LNO81_16420 [Klebsiella variicola subsp. variicola]|nr:hypothetical protein [Klebsiella variicola subsp. variicola]
MSNEILANPAPAAEKHVVQRLRPNAVGLGGVLFMTIATAAPITAMLGNVPIAVGSGNGQFAPAGFMVATLILALFAIGYAQMARFITATGAFLWLYFTRPWADRWHGVRSDGDHDLHCL